MVDFNDNGLEVIQNHDIKSKDMKAHIALILLGLTVLILMANGRESTDDSFDNRVFDLLFEFLDVDSIFGQSLIH